jgi:hypothetical protein
LASLTLCAGLLTSAIVFMLFLLVRAFGIPLARTVVLVLCSALAIAELLYLRSWLFSVLFFLLELYIVFRPTAKPKVAILYAAILFALWANIHIQFTYGIALLIAFLMEAVVLNGIRKQDLLFAPQWSLLDRSMLLITSSAATLVNPYGYHVYEVFREYATQTQVFQYIQEFLPFSLTSMLRVFVLIIGAAALCAVAYYRERRPFLILFLAAALLVGFRMNRDVWVLVVVSVFVIAAASRNGNEAIRLAPETTVKAAVVSLLLILGIWKLKSIDSQHLSTSVARHFPVAAAEFIERNHLSGPMFNSYGWGSYLLWRLPSIPVSIDGRTNLYGPERIAQHVHTMRGLPGWSGDASLQKARLVVIERNTALASLLELDSCHKLVYSDKVSAVFVASDSCTATALASRSLLKDPMD